MNHFNLKNISTLFIVYLLLSFLISKEYVLLVSFDGFRYDYSDMVDTPNFDRIRDEGVKAESLVPVFPTLTFPNHYSIATGCYSNKHRIISNTFYSKTLEKKYSMYDRNTVIDSSFYGAEPIWVTAEKNGLKSASYFWVGSEAIGKTPSIYKNYDSSVSFTSRVDSVISWFNLSESKRPDLVLLYFNEPDHTGHMFGPESTEIADMITQTDQLLGYIVKQINTLDIRDKINLIVISDHGMSQVTQDKLIFLDDFIPRDMVYFEGGGSIGMINEKEKEFSIKKPFKKTRYSLREIYKHIEFVEFMDVYKTKDIPKEFNFLNKDSPDFLLVANNGWFITDRDNSSRVGRTLNGMHGYDPKYRETHGIFYASGPSFRRGYVANSFENIHVYPIICNILNIPEYNNIDGDINQVRGILR
tara:strand:- start:4547 stop:5791 length:1245 start_codon:yes stop_codon:yes gene_type:complete